MIKYSCIIFSLILMSCKEVKREWFVDKALINLNEEILVENQFRLIIRQGERFSVININKNIVVEKKVEFYVDRKTAIKTDSIINIQIDTLSLEGKEILIKYYRDTLLLELKGGDEIDGMIGIESYDIEFVLDGNVKYYSYQYPQKEILPLFQLFVDYPLNPPSRE